MTIYARKTTVSQEKSRVEIERLLARYKATKFASGWEADRAVILFEAHDRRVRFELLMPLMTDKAIASRRTPKARIAAHEQECRRRWRALVLVIKAKLEAVETGITTFEKEFLAHILLPDGRTVGQWAAPQLFSVYKNNKMPALLMPASGPKESTDG